MAFPFLACVFALVGPQTAAQSGHKVASQHGLRVRGNGYSGDANIFAREGRTPMTQKPEKILGPQISAEMASDFSMVDFASTQIAQRPEFDMLEAYETEKGDEKFTRGF